MHVFWTIFFNSSKGALSQLETVTEDHNEDDDKEKLPTSDQSSETQPLVSNTKTEQDDNEDKNVLEENTATATENLTDKNGANSSADTTDSLVADEDSVESDATAEKLEETEEVKDADDDDDGESAEEEESAFPDTQIDLQLVTGSKWVVKDVSTSVNHLNTWNISVCVELRIGCTEVKTVDQDFQVVNADV